MTLGTLECAFHLVELLQSLTLYSFRHYIGLFREEHLLNSLSTILDDVKTYNFEVQSLEPHHKDGGVFVKFTYTPEGHEDAALDTILRELKESSTSLWYVQSTLLTTQSCSKRLVLGNKSTIRQDESPCSTFTNGNAITHRKGEGVS